MEKEKKIFLQILEDYVKERESVRIPANVNWDSIVEFAHRHNLMGIFYVQCQKILETVPEQRQPYEKLRAGFLTEVSSAVCRNQDFAEMQARFTKEGILFLPCKGIVLADYYPEPMLRTMGDIDIVIREEDRQRTHAIMEDMGYFSKHDISSVWDYYRDITHIEIHDKIIYEPLANTLDYQEYFGHVWQHVQKQKDGSWQLEENFHFLYLITHMAKHMMHKGSGFRPFLDVVFMVKRAGERMDWEWIYGELKRLRLLDYAKICSALCSRWFDIELPIEAKKMDGKMLDEISDKIFEDGIFGNFNGKKDAVYLALEAYRSRFPYWFFSIANIWKKMFPPYEDMRKIEYYSFLDGRPWLLPAAWIYRCYYCVKHKRKKSMDNLFAVRKRREKIQERQEELKKLGF